MAWTQSILGGNMELTASHDQNNLQRRGDRLAICDDNVVKPLDPTRLPTMKLYTLAKTSPGDS